MLKGIGSRIKKIRLQKKMTQEQLAEKTNLSLTCISRLENEKSMVSIEKLRTIAQALNTDLSVILCSYMTPSTASTEEEAELVNKFRQLSSESRKGVLAFIDIIFRNNN